MKLSDYKDEEAIEVLADILDPSVDILQDAEIAKVMSRKDITDKIKVTKALKLAMKNHSKSVMELMAGLNRQPVEDFHCDMLTLPKMLLDILNDKELLSFFQYQGQSLEESNSGFVTESTEEISEQREDS